MGVRSSGRMRRNNDRKEGVSEPSGDGNGDGLAGSATFPIGSEEGKDEKGKEGCIINVCHRIGVACQILSGEEEGGGSCLCNSGSVIRGVF